MPNDLDDDFDAGFSEVATADAPTTTPEPAQAAPANEPPAVAAPAVDQAAPVVAEPAVAAPKPKYAKITEDELASLRAQVETLTKENAALREALLAIQPYYDPDTDDEKEAWSMVWTAL